MYLGFVYEIKCFDTTGVVLWHRVQHNLVPDEGRLYILRAAFAGGVQHYPWYVGLYQNDYAPSRNESLSTLIPNCGEITVYSDTQNKRPLFIADLSTNGVWGNYGREIRLTFTDAATIRGLFITSSAAWNSSTGLLLSVAQLPSPEVVNIGQSITVAAGVAFLT